MEDPAMVFCRTRMEVSRWSKLKGGRQSEALHGGMEQRQRDR
jgi:superfamily II DNA/RNA helicase